MDVRLAGLVPAPLTAAAAPKASREAAAAPPADVVEASGARPIHASLGIASRIESACSLGMLWGRPRQPTAEEKVHQENLQALERLQAKGMKLTRVRGFRIPLLMKKVVDVTPEQALKAIEKGQGNIRISDAAHIPVAIRSLDDLAVLSAVHHLGASTTAAHPGLARALASMSGSVHFKARDSEQKDDRAYFYDPASEIGPLGAYQVLTGDTRFRDFHVDAGGVTYKPSDAEYLVAFNYFKLKGASTDLAHPALGSALMQLKSSNVTIWDGHSAVEPQDAYLSMVRRGKPSVSVGNSHGSLMEVERKRLESDPNVALDIQQRLQAFDRLLAVAKDGTLAREALMALDADVPGHTPSQREQVMLDLLGMKDARGAVSVYQELVKAGKPLAASLAELKSCAALYAEPTLARASESWAHMRKLEQGGPAGMPFAEKIQRYQGLLQGMQSHEAAVETFTLVYGDGRSEEYERRETAFGRLVQIQGTRNQAPATALPIYEALAASARPGEDLDRAVSVFERVVPMAKTESYRGDAALEAFRAIRGLVLEGGPKDMAEDARVERFLALMGRVDGNVSTATRAWEILNAGGDTAGLEMRERLLDRIAQAHGGDLGKASYDLRQVEDATREEGGLSGPVAARFLSLMDHCHSFSDALDARKRIDSATMPKDVTSREIIYCAMASGRREVPAPTGRWGDPQGKGEAIMDDYWFVVRNLAASDEDPRAVAESYGAFVAAARGNSSEARRAYAMAREHLADGGLLGLDAATRHQWLARSLTAAGEADGAWRLLTLAETAPDAATGEERLAVLETLIPVAKRLGSESVFEDAIGMLDRLVALSPGSQVTVPEAAAALATVVEKVGEPGYHRADHWLLLSETFLKLDRSLDDVVADARAFGAFAAGAWAEAPWTAMGVWRHVEAGPEGLPAAERRAAMAALLEVHGEVQATIAAYDAACAGATSPGQLKRNCDDLLKVLRTARGDNGIETYQAIALHVEATGKAPGSEDSAVRRARFATMVAKGVGLEEMRQGWAVTRVPVGRESDADREEVLEVLLDAGGPRRGRMDDALASYTALAADLYPGDTLMATAEAFIGLAKAVGSSDSARRMVGEIQAKRLEGDFVGKTLDQLIGAFVDAYALSGDASRAFAVMGERAREAATVRHEDGGVNIGGIRIPRKAAEE